MRRALFLIALSASLGCPEEEEDVCPGSAGCACSSTDECDEGLTCVSMDPALPIGLAGASCENRG